MGQTAADLYPLFIVTVSPPSYFAKALKHAWNKYCPVCEWRIEPEKLDPRFSTLAIFVIGFYVPVSEKLLFLNL